MALLPRSARLRRWRWDRGAAELGGWGYGWRIRKTAGFLFPDSLRHPAGAGRRVPTRESSEQAELGRSANGPSWSRKKPKTSYSSPAHQKRGTGLSSSLRRGKENSARVESSRPCRLPPAIIDGQMGQTRWAARHTTLRACLGELQLCKNSSRAADPRNFTVEQLHRGSEIPKSVWYSSRFAIITMTYRAHMSSQNKKTNPLLVFYRRHATRGLAGAGAARPRRGGL
jgi:hypothetical protein